MDRRTEDRSMRWRGHSAAGGAAQIAGDAMKCLRVVSATGLSDVTSTHDAEHQKEKERVFRYGLE
jgi:hypothetical protein